jgi:DNA-binding IclR family transcriptional regulator
VIVKAGELKAGEQRVDSVERALAILEAFNEEEPTLSLAQLSMRTGLYKSTILRLAASLDRFGYLARNEDGRFRLGPSLWRLGSLARKAYDLGEYVRPVLRDLVAETGETAAFYVRAGDKRLCLYRLNSPRPVRHHLDEGAMLPIDRGASGKVLLAFDGAEGAELDATRGRGFYYSEGERDQDVGAIAVPVFDQAGLLRGALSISALITRLGAEKVDPTVDCLNRAANVLREQLPT